MILAFLGLVGCSGSVKNDELETALQGTGYDASIIKNLDPTPGDGEITGDDWRAIQSTNQDEVNKLIGVLRQKQSPLATEISEYLAPASVANASQADDDGKGIPFDGMIMGGP